jgi:hypothetical protein
MMKLDTLKLEVKIIEQKVKVLEKQVKAQPSQDNHRNMMNKLKKGKNCSQACSSTTKEAYSS